MPSYILKILFLGAMMALAACTDILETGNFREDGVVYRQTVTGPAVARDRGPFCGEDKLVSGIKGVAIPRNAYVPPQDYLIGPGDQLRLNIFGEQGLTNVVATVDNSGFIQLPIIEVVHVADMDTREIHGMLKNLYGEYFSNPWLTVELAVAESHPIYFLGEFRQSGVGYLKRSTNIIEAIAMGGGLEEDAYLSGARLLRNNMVCTVDLFALLREGDFSQNVAIQGGDALFSPTQRRLECLRPWRCREPRCSHIWDRAKITPGIHRDGRRSEKSRKTTHPCPRCAAALPGLW